MKSFAPLVGFSLALMAVGLGSGCASSTPTATYHQPAQDFEVVESSTDRPLTDIEKAEVRSSVASYLAREGVSDSGDYFLKVYLTPENVDAESEWVVVRFTQYTAQRVAVVSSYPYDSLMYSSYYPYYAYDVYPYGYGCVARISFQYYVDPFYHQRYYYYPRHGHGGHKGDNHNTANNHGGKPNHSGDHNGPGSNPVPNRPSGSGYTGNRPPTAPLDGATPTRYNRNYPYTPVAQQEANATTAGAEQQRNDSNRRNQWRGRPGVDARPSGTASSGTTNTRNRPDTPNSVTNPNPDTPVTQQGSTATTAGTGQPRDNPRDQWRGRRGGDSGTSNIANTGNRTDATNRQNNPSSRPQNYRPVNSTTASTQNSAGNPPAQRRNDRTNPRPAPSGVNNPTRTEAYVSPTQNRPAPSINRPTTAPRTAPTVDRPAPSYSRPAPSVQQTRAPAPSYQQPARSAPSSSDSGSGDTRQNSNNPREAMR